MTESSGGSSPVDPSWDGGGGSKPAKICGVCGDRAKSYHFGGISCDSCKAFFRRSVQNDAFKNFHCPYDGKCDISMSSRKCCQFCRFNKCLSIGMEKTWVMSEEERLQMLRMRMERRSRQSDPGEVSSQLQQKRWSRDPEPPMDDMSKFMTEEEMQSVHDVVELYKISYREIPFAMELREIADQSVKSSVDVINMFTTVIKRFAHFANLLPSFQRLCRHDQSILLRTGMVEMCAIRGVYTYDARHDRWPDKTHKLYEDAPFVDAEALSKLVSPETFTLHMRFTRGMRELHPDEATLMLLVVAVMYSPDRWGLKEPHLVEEQQERYLLLLRKYMNWRYTPSQAAILYPKLLLKLPDLRELSDAHSKQELRLGREEIAEIQSQLHGLCLVESSGAEDGSGAIRDIPQFLWAAIRSQGESGAESSPQVELAPRSGHHPHLLRLEEPPIPLEPEQRFHSTDLARGHSLGEPPIHPFHFSHVQTQFFSSRHIQRNTNQ